MNTESNYDMKTKLERIAEMSKANPNQQFNNLIHHINPEMLKQCHKEMKVNKATGVDEVDKKMYEENLETNIIDLWERLKRFGYKPQPVRRVYIPKPGSEKQRPLGIPAYEDRLVQAAIAKLLNAIWEPIFKEYSYGFRPNRGCHQALGAITYLLENKEIRYVVDVDIKGFFDHLDHEFLIKFLEHKITDRNFIRLMKRVLKANISENGKLTLVKEGAPQGGQTSPVLANIYLHYVLDLWFKKVIKKTCRKGAYMIRYADDVVCCFGEKEEAEWFYKMLIERMGQFNLELAEDKSKIIEFGRYAERECRERNEKVSTFDFLGFTHYCSHDKSGKRYRVKRITSKKKKIGKKRALKIWLSKNRHERPEWLIMKLNKSLTGYYNYYGITDNGRCIQEMRRHVEVMLYKTLRRRGNRHKLSWESYFKILGSYPLAKARTKVNIYEIIRGLKVDAL